jgi:hypothetical protein
MACMSLRLSSVRPTGVSVAPRRAAPKRVMAAPRAAVATGNIVETAKAAGSFNTLITALTATGALRASGARGWRSGWWCHVPRRGTTARAREPRSGSAHSAAARSAADAGCAQRARRARARRALAPRRRFGCGALARRTSETAARARAHPARARRRTHRMAQQLHPARRMPLQWHPTARF